MWRNSFMYTIPIASILAKIRLSENTIIRGDLQEELSKLFDAHIPNGSIKLVRNDEIDASANMIYEKGTNLLKIFTDVLAALELGFDLKVTNDGLVRLMLKLKDEGGEIQNESFDFGS